MTTPSTTSSATPPSPETSVRRVLRGLDLEDLELHLAAGGGNLDRLALLLSDDGLPDGRLVREVVLGRIRFGGADDVVLDRLLRVDVTKLHLRSDRDDVLGDV